MKTFGVHSAGNARTYTHNKFEEIYLIISTNLLNLFEVYSVDNAHTHWKINCSNLF